MRKRKSLSQKSKEYNQRNQSGKMVYYLLEVFVIIHMLIQIKNGNLENTVLCIMTLLLFEIPKIISKKWNILFPEPLEITVYLFIFFAGVLGEIQNFYGRIPHWDTMLHTLNGFLFASVAYSFLKIKETKCMSSIIITLIIFSFSMTVGVLWEFTEYGIDQFFGKDMQKDRIVERFQSVKINPKKENIPIDTKTIKKTIIFLTNGKTIVINKGYLDLGLQDTMKDLLVNGIGAIAFSLIEYYDSRNREKNHLIEKIILKKKTEVGSII